MTDFILYFQIGWSHIISRDALDHLYFISLLSIVYRFVDWKKVLILITAFTIGHALTLFLSVLDLVRIKDSYVEFAIPCTIVITAAVNLFKSKDLLQASSIHYGMALFFGLIHGLGYANTIKFMLASDQNILASLLSFNLGLESGQIFVVLLILFLVWVTSKTRFFTQRDLVMFFSVIILSLSLKMAIERFPFFQ